MKTVALITARGGSKQIPKKNIINIKGEPLISYTIRCAKQSNVEEVWVSTDCEEISEVSKKYGAKVIKRPKELSGDIIMPDAALVHFAENHDFDILVFIQPTSPLLHPKFINLGLSRANKYDSLFSAYREHWSPRWSLSGEPIGWQTTNRPRRQDVSENFVENGAFYITRRTLLLESGLRYSGKIGVVEMPMKLSFQIDSYQDLDLVKELI
jgi:N-acylneuraminate cytidylyltransferase